MIQHPLRNTNLNDITKYFSNKIIILNKVDLKIKCDVRFIIYIHAMITSLSNTI